jgi:uncharacterized membrane protein
MIVAASINNALKRFFSHDLTITLFLIIGSWIFYGIKAGSAPFWYDELFTVFWTQYDNVDDVKWVSQWDIAPPGFNVVVYYWNHLFGISEFAVRSLCNLCMAVSFGSLFLFTKRFFGARMALIVAALFITNSLLYFYSNEVRCYAFILMLSIISNFIFAKMILDSKWYLALLLGVVNYYLYYTHYVTVNLLVIQGLFAVGLFNKKLFLWYVCSFIPFYFLLKPFLPRAMAITMQKQEMILEKPTPGVIWKYSVDFFNNGYFGAFLLVLLGIGAIVYFRRPIVTVEKKEKAVVWFLVCSGLGYVLLTFIMAIIKSPIFIYRYMIPSVPGILLLFAFFISRIGSWRTAAAITSIILIAGFCTINTNIYKGTNLKRQMEFAHNYRSPRTAVITDVIYASYYYDKEIFKQVKDLSKTAARNNMFEINKAHELDGFNYWKYDTIFVVANWAVTNENVKGRLTKHFPKYERLKYRWDGTFTFIYHR